MVKVYLFFLLLAIILLSNVPNSYSQVWCISISIFYIVLCFFYLRKVNRFGLFSFDLFFLSGILLTCFIYPSILTDSFISRAFNKVNNDVINKATLVSFVGAISYMIGSLIIFKEHKHSINQKKHFNYTAIKCHRDFKFQMYKSNDAKASGLFCTKRLNLTVLANALNISLIFSCVLIILFLFLGGTNYLYAYDSSQTIDLSPALNILDFYKIFFLILSVLIFARLARYKYLNSIDFLFQFNLLYVFLFLFMLVLLLAGGTRNMPIQFILTVLSLYNITIKKISNKSVFLIILFGLFFFTFIRINRENLETNETTFSTKLNNTKDLKSVDLFTDLLGSSATLYTLINEADKNGLNYGKSMLFPVLSVIPFAQYTVLNALNLNLKEFEPSSLIATDLIYNSYESGAGTNIIGDLYYSFGPAGVIIFMFLLGNIISFSGNNILISNNIYSLLTYTALFSISFFFARVEYFYGVRYIVWSLILMRLFLYGNLYLKRKKKKLPKNNINLLLVL